MKNKLLNLCGIIVAFLFAAMLPIMLISYFTYTEKTVGLVMLIILVICGTPIMLDHVKNN